ncbi:hypothetical protein BJX96DRAFT_171754 [Aspergillus floccosus]
MPEKVNNAGKNYTAATVIIVLCAISGILMFLRFAEKMRMRAFFAEDYVLIPGFLIYVAMAAILIRANIDGALERAPDILVIRANERVYPYLHYAIL